MNHYSQTLQQIIKKAHRLLVQQSEVEFAQKTKPKRWSKKEILGHLIDSAYNNHQRFLRAEAQGDLIFQGYNQNEWVRKNNYQNRSLEEIVETWRLTNLHLSHLIANLPEASLQQTTTVHNFHIIGMNRPQEGAPSSLSYLIWDYIFHLEHHLVQILEDYERVGDPFEG